MNDKKTKNIPLHSFRLEDELWEKFKEWCYINRTNASEEIKRHIESLVYPSNDDSYSNDKESLLDAERVNNELMGQKIEYLEKKILDQDERLNQIEASLKPKVDEQQQDLNQLDIFADTTM